MVAPAAAFPLNKKSLDGLLKLVKAATTAHNNDTQIRQQLQDIDAAYMRENNLGNDNIESRTANRYGDKSKIQDITVPVIMPQVEAGVVYLSSVFLSGNPIFDVVTNKAAKDDIATMYSAIMEENGIRGGWVRQLNMFFRDGLKYNICGLEVDWESKKIYSVATDTQFSSSEGRPTEVMWEGNTLKRLDMYNTIFDNKVSPSEVHSHGEYAGYTELYSRTRLKQLIQDLGEKAIKDNIRAVLESGNANVAPNTFYQPLINPMALLPQASFTGNNNSFDWAAWATDAARGRIDYSNQYEVMKLYVRIIPSDFDMSVPGKNQPQIWKLIVVNQSVILLAERQTNAHNYLGIIIGHPLEDGLGLQTKSFATNVLPFQEASSALLNASLNSKRRMQFDRLLYNPSLIRQEDINSSNPVARIPVRPAAYTKNLSDAVYAFPYNDSASQSMLQEMGLLVQFADKLQGINQAQQGQFTKGNRTMHEYSDIMAKSDGRLQTLAMFFEAQVFTPIKEMLKLNIMQYAKQGVIYSRELKRTVDIDPLALREEAVEFKVSDGFLPSDKLINSDVMQVALQVFGSSPTLQAEFDISGLFIHFLKTQGARDIEQFRKQTPSLPVTQTPTTPLPPQGATAQGMPMQPLQGQGR